MTERETVIIYSPSMVDQINRTDPDHKKLIERWEKAMGEKVEVSLVDDRLIVKKKCSQ